jgi:hypothetical protein
MVPAERGTGPEGGGVRSGLFVADSAANPAPEAPPCLGSRARDYQRGRTSRIPVVTWVRHATPRASVMIAENRPSPATIGARLSLSPFPPTERAEA